MSKKLNPKAYTADRDVYVDQKYYKAGHVFVTDHDPEDFWTKVDDPTAHAIQASTEEIATDPPLEGLSKEALEAVAVTKHVNPTGMGKKKLVDAVKAADEPKL